MVVVGVELVFDVDEEEADDDTDVTVEGGAVPEASP
jgi:hypothetical protein